MNNYYINIPDETLLTWSREIKNWYNIDCTDLNLLRRAAMYLPQEACGSLPEDPEQFDPEPYDEVFLRDGNTWRKHLDTADREALYVYITNEIKKLHCEKGPAMVDENGFKFYYLNGKEVDPDTIVELWLARGVFCYYNEQDQSLNFEEQ